MPHTAHTSMHRWDRARLRSWLADAPCELKFDTPATARAARAALYRLPPPADILIALRGSALTLRRLSPLIMEMTKL